ncbi:hypothetical protein D3C87_1221250 [compost metagenome]
MLNNGCTALSTFKAHTTDSARVVGIRGPAGVKVEKSALRSNFCSCESNELSRSRFSGCLTDSMGAAEVNVSRNPLMDADNETGWPTRLSSQLGPMIHSSHDCFDSSAGFSCA